MHGAVHHVRSNRAGSGKLARALSSEHGIAQHAAGDLYAVEHIVHPSQGMLHRKHERRHHRAHASVLKDPAPGQKLDRHARRPGVGEIGRGYLRDSLCHDPVRGHVLPGEHIRQYGYLAPCVKPLHICLGVALRIAQLLGLLQHLPVVRPFLFHLGQDEVGGAVQDACHRLHPVRRQRAVDGTDDGDAARHAGLEHIVAPHPLRDGQELGPVLRHQLLVGGAHALSCLQRLLRELIRRAHAPHDLAQDAYLRVVQNRSEIMYDSVLIRVSGEIPEIQDVLDIDFLAGPFTEQLRVARNNLHNTAAHGPVSQHCYFYHRSSSPLSRLSLGLTAPWQLTPGDICPSRPARFPELPESAPLRPSPPARWPLLFCPYPLYSCLWR